MASTQRQQKMKGIKNEIDGFLGNSLSEEEWNDLLQEHYIDEVLRGSLSTRQAADKVLHRRHVYGGRKLLKSDTPRMLSEQDVKESTDPSTLISLFIAQEAAEDAEVQRFRTEVLADRLLPWETVEEWIQQQVQKDGPPTTWLNNLPLSQVEAEKIGKLLLGNTPDTPLLQLEIPTDQVMGNIRLQAHVLKYLGPDGWSRSVATSLGGILERLRWLSERLAEQYQWKAAQATLFVLTGTTPLISPLSYTFKGAIRPLFNRIVLEVDPVLLPKEVAEHYSGLRNEIMTGRTRKLSEKHMQLALFDAQRPKSETWAKKMAEWNRTHPEWKYEEEVANFAHDCLKARQRLLRSE